MAVSLVEVEGGTRCLRGGGTGEQTLELVFAYVYGRWWGDNVGSEIVYHYGVWDNNGREEIGC